MNENLKKVLSFLDEVQTYYLATVDGDQPKVRPFGTALVYHDKLYIHQANAEADKKERERIDKLNQADSIIFQTEKQLKEYGDKLPADTKAEIEAALGKLKTAHQAQDIAGIDAAMNEMNAMWQKASEEMYKNAGAQGGPQGGFDPNNMGGGFQGGNPNQGPQNGGGDDTVTDADFEEVK